MLESKQLYLSRADTLNDAYEGGRRIKEKRNVFIASFSSSRLESIAMWSMYSFPYHKGIRLRFERKKMQAVLNKFKKEPRLYIPNTKKKIIYQYQGKVELSLMDVVYFTNGHIEHYNGNRQRSDNAKPTLIDSIVHPKNNHYDSINWCIKNATWASEIETRLILEFEHPIANHKRIAINFSEALSSMIITCSPCVDISKTKELFKNQREIIFNQSVYNNGTYFRPCSIDSCGDNRTDFCKKNKPN